MAQVALVAAGVAAAGQLYQGYEANKEAGRVSDAEKENARLSLLSGEQQALQTRKDERSIAGDMLAAMAGGGGLLEGSNADLISASAYQRDLEIATIRQQASGEARNHLQAAKSAKRQGRNALIGAGFSALSTAIGGVSDYRASQTMAAQGAKERAGMSKGQVRLPGRAVPVSTNSGFSTIAAGRGY